MSDNGEKRAFLTGLFLGGLAGAAAALLMTPQSGEETRVQIQTTGTYLKSQVGDQAASLQERGKIIVEERVSSRSDVDSGGASSAEEMTKVLTNEDDSATRDA
jgi:gas vesicle protein